MTDDLGLGLPLRELVLGLDVINPGFSSVDFGQYWELVKDRFPTASDKIPIVKRPEPLSPPSMQIPTLPRVWFEGGNWLIQFQQDRFIMNWRALPTGDSHCADYPGFTKVFSRFQEELRVFLDWSNATYDVKPQFDGAELTYINNIDPKIEAADPIFTFREIEWRKPFPEPEFWATRFRFDTTDAVSLEVIVQPALQLSTQDEVLVFELSARRRKALPWNIEDFSAICAWFKEAHNEVSKGFGALVRPKWLSQWEKLGV